MQSEPLSPLSGAPLVMTMCHERQK